MADDAEGAAKGGGGKAGTAMAIALIVIAAGAGAGFNTFVLSNGKTSAPAGKADAHAVPAEVNAARTNDKAGSNDRQEHVFPLEPILVELSGSGGRWIRLEAAVSFHELPGKEELPVLLRYMAEDLMGFLHSTQFSQLETPVGFEFLRDDLSELIRLRSKDRARKLLLKGMVVE